MSGNSSGPSSGSGSSSSAWSQAFSQDELEDDESGLASSEFKRKDAVILLLDCNDTMFAKDEQGRVQFSFIVELAVKFLKIKIIADPNDRIGVVLFNSKAQINSNDFGGIHSFMELGDISAKRIKKIQQLADEEWFEEHVGAAKPDSCELYQALWTCSSLFTAAALKDSFKRVFLITNSDNPNDGPSYDDLKRKAAQKALDLEELDIQVQLFGIARESKFETSKFFKDVLMIDPDEDDGAGNMDKTYANLEDISRGFKKKFHKKRALSSVVLQLGAGVEIAVKLFCLHRTATKEAKGWLDGKTNEPLTCMTNYMCKDTGEILEDYQIATYYPYGGEKVNFTKDEMKQVRTFGDPGLVLMGFKPISCLKVWHNTKNSYFLYPNEQAMKGSSVAMHALLLEMLKLKKMAVARLIYRKATMPRFVALLPQAEKFDEDGCQSLPPGLNLIFLPYADDIRQLKFTPTPIAEPDLIFRAKQVVQSLKINGLEDHPYSNPNLQRHYAVLQALALDEDLPEDQDEVDNQTTAFQPDLDGMAKFEPIMREFKEAVEDSITEEDRQMYAVVSKKRKGTSAESAAKRAKAAEDALTYDWAEMAANGELAKKTMPIMKIYLRAKGLPVSGKKADLFDRIVNHLESSA